jgi:hypothetical protein
LVRARGRGRHGAAVRRRPLVRRARHGALAPTRRAIGTHRCRGREWAGRSRSWSR